MSFCWIFLNDNNLTTVSSNFNVNSRITWLKLNNNNLERPSLDKILLEVDSLGTSNGKLDISSNASTPTGGTKNPNYINLTNRGWDVSI